MKSTKKALTLGLFISTAVVGFFWWKRKEVERAGVMAADPWVFATSGDQSGELHRDAHNESAEPRTTATKMTPAKKAPAKKTTAEKSTAKKASAKKTTAKKAPAKKVGDSV